VRSAALPQAFSHRRSAVNYCNSRPRGTFRPKIAKKQRTQIEPFFLDTFLHNSSKFYTFSRFACPKKKTKQSQFLGVLEFKSTT
jgi:hypothetical protein